MPVIVVGADTPLGADIVDALIEPGREVRAFVTDPETAMTLRAKGVKVALGDVSDDSHIEGAAMNCFSAVLVTEAATDSRERSFAATEEEVLRAWANAVTSVTRVIWVHRGAVPKVSPTEVVVVDPTTPDVASQVRSFDEAREI